VGENCNHITTTMMQRSDGMNEILLQSIRRICGTHAGHTTRAQNLHAPALSSRSLGSVALFQNARGSRVSKVGTSSSQTP
jgi:hypothetical protein